MAGLTRTHWASSSPNRIIPPSRCRVTTSGMSLSVTVKAPNAPCRMIQKSVNQASRALGPGRRLAMIASRITSTPKPAAI